MQAASTGDRCGAGLPVGLNEGVASRDYTMIVAEQSWGPQCMNWSVAYLLAADIRHYRV